MMDRRLRAVVGTAMIWALLTMSVPPAIGQDAQPAQPYKVGPGDQLSVVVLGEPSVSGSFMVSPDGNLDLPLVGQIAVGGLPLDVVQDKIADALKEYVVNPRVTVSLVNGNTNNSFVYVLGQVTHAGSYKMERNWTLAELFAAAGGTQTDADLNSAFILRNNKTIPINLQKLLVDGDTSANMPLEAGDVVIVPESKNQVTVTGAVVKPGGYTFKAGDRVVDALTAAGGTGPEARIQNIGIIRQSADKKTATVVQVNLQKFYASGDLNQNEALLPGDIVYVPAKATVNWQSIVSSLTGIGTLIAILK